MNLFPDEQIVSQSDTGEIILTTHRIIQKQGGFSSSITKSIMLEHITSCQSKYKSNFILLVLAVVAILLSYNAIGMIGFIVAIVLIILFYITRKNEIYISSPTATIHINTSGMSRQNVEDFIDKVENTKNKRLIKLNKI